MFGYVRPLQSELKVRELAAFKAVYCGLCRAMGAAYGGPIRLALNYDFTFLALLLDFSGETSDETFRCALHPLRQRTCRAQSEGLAIAAGVSAILTYYKMLDAKADESGAKQVLAAAGAVGLFGAYRKARADYPAYEALVAEQLERLKEYEEAGEATLDRPADCFASLLSAAPMGDRPETEKRILRELLYHVGRWIYLVDAADDLAEDQRAGRYNPVAARYGNREGVLREEEKEALSFTLDQSLAAASGAFELLDGERDRGVLANILYLGLPEVTRQVLSGTFLAKEKQHGRSL